MPKKILLRMPRTPEEKENYNKIYDERKKQKNHNSRFNTIKRTYNLNKEEFLEKFKSQNGCCEICNKKFQKQRDIRIDHSHTTGKIRGLLCNKCNVCLGIHDENIDLLMSVINYLNKYNF